LHIIFLAKEKEMNMENDEDDEIDENCVTARSETARSSRRPSPSPRKYMSDSLSLTSKTSSHFIWYVLKRRI
jgi:hypothetical protein